MKKTIRSLRGQKVSKFYGRERELFLLNELLEKRTASLVVLRGRRRIGKTRLAEKFSEGFDTVYRFMGLAPEKGVTADIQRKHFGNELEIQSGLTGLRTDDWDFLFHNLAQLTRTGRVLIILDEINWLGNLDPAFLGKLKTAWDQYFNKNSQLILFLSGSMSAWIEKNILSSTGYFGRAELDIVLKELPLKVCDHFWDPYANKISAYEKLKILSVTGGIPRYLESINPKQSAEANIRRLFFRKEALFFNEFDKIFIDLFKNQSELYKKIAECLAQRAADQEKIFKSLDVPKSGVYSENLNNLVLTGYISRDYTWNIKSGKYSKLSQYRLSDNLIRFYLKYVQPHKETVLQGREPASINWEAIMGLQFKNLVLNNRKWIYKLLNIPENEIKIDNPYFRRGTRTQPGVQID